MRKGRVFQVDGLAYINSGIFIFQNCLVLEEDLNQIVLFKMDF